MTRRNPTASRTPRPPATRPPSTPGPGGATRRPPTAGTPRPPGGGAPAGGRRGTPPRSHRRRPSRTRSIAAPAAAFLLGLAGSVLVAVNADIPPRDQGLVVGMTAAGGLAVAITGLTLEMWLRSRRTEVSRLSLLSAVVTAAAVLVGVAAVAGSMLINQHDLAIVLSALPVAVGTGALYGILSGRRATSDLKALAALARRLDHPGRAPPQLIGPAEIEAVANTLTEAATRLASAREHERELEASRRNLVAWVSHDLRTPLTSLRAAAEALSDGMLPNEAARRRYLTSLTTQVERLSRLVDDLFELAQLDAGGTTLRLEPTDLPDLIIEVMDRFGPGAEAVGVDLTVEVPVDPGVVMIGRDQMARVLANLVANGIRHTPPGGRVLIGVAGTAVGTVLRVTDQCGGIPPRDLPRVFDRMWRGDPARSSDGAGLGLAIARGLVTAHGGEIAVRNVAGGCQFTVRIPPQAAAALPPPPGGRDAAVR